MALADDVQDLTTRTLSAPEASHDYYTYTKRVWRLMQQIEGAKCSRMVTGIGARIFAA